MKIAIKSALMTFCITLLAIPAHAVQPVSISSGKLLTADNGTTYRSHTVNCSNNANVTISSWRSSHKWCVGQDEGRCSVRRTKMAKIACNESLWRDNSAVSQK